MNKTKVIFMGTPQFCVPILEYLNKNTNVVLVVTQPDRKVGRKGDISFSPVKKFALSNNIPVIQPNKVKDDFEIISECNPDLIITCAYGQIIPESILNIPVLGSLNVHASLLPKYRGASPIQSVILNGEKETGVTLMYMDKGMDTGDIIASLKCDILENDNFEILHDKLSLLGVNVLEHNLESIINKTNNREKQDNNLASYTRLITREDEKIDFNDSGINIINKIRAFNPYPLAYFKLNDNEIKVLEAFYNSDKKISVGEVIINKKSMLIGCIDGAIEIKKIKPIGKGIMNIENYLNGLKKDINYYVK